MKTTSNSDTGSVVLSATAANAPAAPVAGGAAGYFVHAQHQASDPDVQAILTIGGTFTDATLVVEGMGPGGSGLWAKVPMVAATVPQTTLAGTDTPADSTTKRYILDTRGFKWLSVRFSAGTITSGNVEISSGRELDFGRSTANYSNLSVVSVVGYSVGVGAAVTQITSRTTGVTCNAPSGAITLVSAAGSATAFTMTVTNSQVAATDTVVVSQKSGTDAYRADVSAVAAGSFKLTIVDLTGTTTEQPVFNFAVVKAVAS